MTKGNTPRLLVQLAKQIIEAEAAKPHKPTSRGPGSKMRSYLVSEETIRKLKELESRFGLNFSDSVRRGVDYLHDYLINHKQPRNPDDQENLPTPGNRQSVRPGPGPGGP